MTITTNFDTNPSTGDKAGTFADVTRDILIELEKNFASTSAPTSPVNGMVWVDTTTATRYLGKLRQNGAWVAMVLSHILEEDLNCDLNQLTNLIIENVGASPTGNVGEEGMLVYNTALQEMQFATDTVGRTLVSVGAGTTEKGIPAVLPQPGQVFSTVGDTARLRTRIPAAWDAASDIECELQSALSQAETVADDVDWLGDWRAMTPGAEGITKTQSTTAAVYTDIGSLNASGDLHSSTLVMSYSATGQSPQAGDLLEIDVRRPVLGEVGGVSLEAAMFFFKVTSSFED